MKENKIPSAEEFFPISEQWGRTGKLVHVAMVEFAKLHVKAALREASDKYEWDLTFKSDNPEYLKQSILSAYPEELIK